MQTSRTTQPPQPPKESAYTQSSNPVTHNPSETTTAKTEQRSFGDPTPSITRGASSNPSTASTLANASNRHKTQLEEMQRSGDVDTEYGIEQQPAEGSIAQAVEGQSRHRMQAGAHAGAVGNAQGPGAPASGEGVSNLADLDRKREDHERILGDRVGKSPPVPDGASAEREEVRARKLKLDRELRPGDVVREVTGDPVVGR
ncbi:hypothetical protein BJX99DRAFT_172690 [Aspergillus californicus]